MEPSSARFLALLILFCGAIVKTVESFEKDDVIKHNTKVGEKRISAQILALIDHYKQEDPVGIPGAPIPDPMPVPDISKSLGLATFNMRNVLAHGLSKFRIKNLNIDIKELKAFVGIQLDSMNMVGDYTLSSLFSRTQGPFKVMLKNVMVKGNASLAVQRDGMIKTDDIQIDITFSDMAMDFQNLGILGSVFQGFINSAPTLVFDSMKPFMLAEAYKQIRTEIDSNIANATGEFRFPNSISPLDMAIAEGRKKVRSMGYEPYMIRDYNHTMGLFSMQMTNTYLTGASSFYRVGNMTVVMANNTISMRFQVGTQKLAGATQWEVGMGNGMVTRAGHAEFTVQHIKATIEVSQALDLRKRPQIKDLQFDLGNIQIRCDGAGTLDYILEFGVNVLPNLLRYQIMDGLENPIKVRIQEKMNAIDVEMAIRQYLPQFEKMGLDADFNFKL